MDLAEILKALADANRLRILHFLGDRTLCVCDLEEALKLEQSNLSRHLAKLKQVGLVRSSKRAQYVYYTRSPLPEPYGSVVDGLYRAMELDPAWRNGRASFSLKTPC